jgi:hypothetical protein
MLRFLVIADPSYSEQLRGSPDYTNFSSPVEIHKPWTTYHWCGLELERRWAGEWTVDDRGVTAALLHSKPYTISSERWP